MTEPFFGEVQIFAFDFAPYNWSFADGSMLPIRQSAALYSLYGVTFGGDGSSTFALPNLVARGACGAGAMPGGTPRSMGDSFGEAGVALVSDQMPMHLHTLYDYQPDTGLVAVPTPQSAIGWSANSTFNAFAIPTGSTGAKMNPAALGPSGAGTPHENRQPFLALNYCVSLAGDYPMFD